MIMSVRLVLELVRVCQFSKAFETYDQTLDLGWGQENKMFTSALRLLLLKQMEAPLKTSSLL